MTSTEAPAVIHGPAPRARPLLHLMVRPRPGARFRRCPSTQAHLMRLQTLSSGGAAGGDAHMCTAALACCISKTALRATSIPSDTAVHCFSESTSAPPPPTHTMHPLCTNGVWPINAISSPRDRYSSGRLTRSPNLRYLRLLPRTRDVPPPALSLVATTTTTSPGGFTCRSLPLFAGNVACRREGKRDRQRRRRQAPLRNLRTTREQRRAQL